MHPRDYTYKPKMDAYGWAMFLQAKDLVEQERETPWWRWVHRSDLRRTRRHVAGEWMKCLGDKPGEWVEIPPGFVP